VTVVHHDDPQQVRVKALCESQKLPAQRRMIGQVGTIVKKNLDGYVLVRVGETCAWTRPEHLKPVKP